MVVDTWGDIFTRSLQGVWIGVASFLPSLFIALIILAIGWVLAALIEKLIESLFKTLKVDAALKSAGMEDIVHRAGYSLNSGLFVGAVCKWFVIIVFLIASFDILGLSQVNLFLGQIVDYLPNVIVAAIILMAAAVIANTLQKIVVASARAGQIHAAELGGRVVKWAIWIFAIITALDKLVIIPGLIQIILTPLMFGIALAFGLSFGLGGKDLAQKALEQTSKAISHKE